MDSLVIMANAENLDAVLDFVNERSSDCPIKVRTQIAIAVDEIFSNIANYAYNPDVGPVMVHIEVDKDITIIFQDIGVAYNPLDKKDPDITLSAEEREIGGLGIFMVKNIMDSVEYRREGDKNILTIKKSLV